jgi:branched-chain amino acid transport system substrate-binding protein
MGPRWKCLVSGGAALAVIGSSLAFAGTASAAPAPIKIAMVSSLTGAGASAFDAAPQGFLSRIDLQNAKGGIDGHKIEPIIIDDQTNPTTAQTAVQEAISKGVAGIVSVSPLFFEGAKFAQQAGIPVTGGFFDGPEWGQQPNTNMFASDAGSVNPAYPVNTLIGKILKAHGATVLGTYGYGISPSSSRSAIGTADSAQRVGIKVGVLDTSVPYGSVNFGTEALVAKSKNVDSLYVGMQLNSNLAMLTALKQAGVKLKVVVFPTGYQPDIVHSPSWPQVQGAYFIATMRPMAAANAGTQELQSALQKYAHRKPANFPTYDIYESWLGADLMIKGLTLAGPNATHAQVIHALRGIKAYNGNGLLPQTINYSTIFGKDLPQACYWLMQAKPQGFVLTSPTPTCGHDIPGTSTANAS